jgi:uncharacterized protein with HEPN domain
MSRSPLDYLRHIRDETVYLMAQTEGLTQAHFSRDATLQRAFVRSIEIIGESAKQTPDDFKQKYSPIEWRAMAEMHDRLIHGYFGITTTSCGMSSRTRFRRCARQLRK